MRHRNARIILATLAITGVVGAGVAVAADAPTCPYGNTPKAAQNAPARGSGNGTQLQLRERDGTGPRHARRSARNRSGNGQRQHQSSGNRGASCPYRS